VSTQWDIRLQCTVCGERQRRCRADGTPPFGHEPVATVFSVCHNCHANADYPDEEVKTLHFVDYATDDELINEPG